MTTNIDRAAEVIGEAYQEAMDSGTPSTWRYQIARALADAGLLMPDLPKPYTEAVHGEAAVTAWQPCYSVARSEIHLPVGNVWIEGTDVIGFDTDHSEQHLDLRDARALALALLAAANHAEEATRADS